MKITKEEYKKAKKIIKKYEAQNPVKTVGVLVFDVYDFLLFMKTFQSCDLYDVSNRRFSCDNKVYYRIFNEHNLIGLTIDETIVTDAAKQRPDYEKTLAAAKICIKKSR